MEAAGHDPVTNDRSVLANDLKFLQSDRAFSELNGRAADAHEQIEGRSRSGVPDRLDPGRHHARHFPQGDGRGDDAGDRGRSGRREGAFEDKLRAVMSAQLAFFSQNREFFRLYLSLRMPEGTPAQQRRQQRTCRPQYRQRVDKMAEVLSQAIARGELRELDAARLALFIIEGSTAVILERLTEKTSPAESADVDLLVGLILDGVRKRS
jgi:hypothetical protein